MKGRFSPSFLWACGVATAALILAVLPSVAAEDWHPPIRIVDNDGFAELGSGVRSGTGTQGDPYIISDWTIGTTPVHGVYAPTAPTAISLEGTDAHVRIERMSFHDGFETQIRIQDASNVVIADSIIHGSQPIQVQAPDIRLENLRLTGPGPAWVNVTGLINHGDFHGLEVPVQGRIMIEGEPGAGAAVRVTGSSIDANVTIRDAGHLLVQSSSIGEGSFTSLSRLDSVRLEGVTVGGSQTTHLQISKVQLLEFDGVDAQEADIRLYGKDAVLKDVALEGGLFNVAGEGGLLELNGFSARGLAEMSISDYRRATAHGIDATSSWGALLFYRIDTLTMSGVVVEESARDGLVISEIRDLALSNATVTGNAGVGLFLFKIAAANVSDFAAARNGEGLKMQDITRGSIAHINMESNMRGLFVEESGREGSINIRAIYVSGAGTEAIRMQDSHAYLEHVEIEGASLGVYVEGSRMTALDLSIDGAALGGLAIGPRTMASHVTLVDVQLDRMGLYAMNIVGNSSVSIRDSLLAGGNCAGILSSAHRDSEIHVVNSTIQGYGTDGLLLGPIYVVQDNLFAENGRHAIIVDRPDPALQKANRFLQNGQDIYVRKSGAENEGRGLDPCFIEVGDLTTPPPTSSPPKKTVPGPSAISGIGALALANLFRGSRRWPGPRARRILRNARPGLNRSPITCQARRCRKAFLAPAV